MNQSPTPSPLGGLFADPSLAVFGGRYYLYPTTDGLEGWASRSFSVLSSDDLVEWTNHGEILKLGVDVAWAEEKAWAPAIAERDGSYYFYYSANGNIGVAVADSPTGPFRDIGRPLVAAGDYGGTAIDPSVFRDDDGIYYLYWGNGLAHGVPLAPDMVSFDPGSVVSWVPDGFREAAWVHRRGATYYLSWSENDTREADYRVRYATGSGPLGPWADQGVLLEKDVERGILATGHHAITGLPGSDEWVIAYHRFAIPGGNGYNREIIFDPLIHRPDGLLEKVRPSSKPLRRPLNGRA
ncbi:family 43 glycosylhydrolase [Arthrobacter sp. ISL-30]|uniref:family 43 glycosylhydrolase n=1 Tax=Arthrobacter sp. ISL-30 TaxID=2819109 RepID=UPI001BE92BE6|nr:family 43 glycosylhydrolase [Arthrobacter sp. ISL-30]MBT2511998.1 family 43 glycosylhydrolase [Arthrobacter sp. ISL-30]